MDAVLSSGVDECLQVCAKKLLCTMHISGSFHRTEVIMALVTQFLGTLNEQIHLKKQI